MGNTRRRPSPAPVRIRHGRHVTNINRIEVVNNFGTGGGGGSFPTPWTKTKRGRESRDANLVWCAVRVGLAVAIVFWFGTVVAVVRSAHGERGPAGTVPARSTAGKNPARRKEPSERTIGRPAAPRGGTEAAVDSPAARPADAAEDEGGAPGPASDGGRPHSIFELSMFGNQSPSDFQLYTPHAPSCSKPLQGADVSYTLVSQLSEDRLWMVQYHCQRWGDNPMSLVVFSDRKADDVKSELVGQGCSDEHVTVQTVSPTKYDPTGTEYPVNLLRNIALAAVRTTHVVYADVDFWPSTDLQSTLDQPSVRERFASDPKLAAVVPVFQMSRRCREYKDCRGSNVPVMPKKKAALFNLIKKKQASTFDPTNVGGHGSTKYITWRDQESGTFVDLPCIKSNRYEPYLAFRYCSDLPPFQEGFTGYGKNKMTWVMQLRRAGYLFSQLGGVFLVHYPHLSSQARAEWDKKPWSLERRGKTLSDLNKKEREVIDWGSYKRARVDALFLAFKEWLDGTVEDESRAPMCRDALNDDVRLWVHPDERGAGGEEDDDGAEEEDTDDGAYFEEYNDYLESKEAYAQCREEEEQDAPAECVEAASDFIESSILWSLVGSEAGYLGPATQMKYLVEAEECAKRLMALQPPPGENDDDGSDDYSFQNLVADLYTNMGVAAKNSHSKSTARTYIDKALALNPNHTSALKILSQLTAENSATENPEDADKEVAVQSPDNSEVVDGGGVEEKKIVSEDGASKSIA